MSSCSSGISRNLVLYCGLPACLSGCSGGYRRPESAPPRDLRRRDASVEGSYALAALLACSCARLLLASRAQRAVPRPLADPPAHISYRRRRARRSSGTGSRTPRPRTCRCSPATASAPRTAASRSSSPTAARSTSTRTPPSTSSPTNSSGCSKDGCGSPFPDRTRQVSLPIDAPSALGADRVARRISGLRARAAIADAARSSSPSCAARRNW